MLIELQHLTIPTDDARQLLSELDDELNAAYSSEQRHGYSISRLFQPHIAFFIARADGHPAGCGGIAFEDGFAELKRMYVRPAMRGHGIAQAILNRLETEARARDINRLTLETGDAQLAAIRFYERAGFTRCPAFGAYMKMPPEQTVRSVFLEKKIG